jgi:hypothetical protein
MFLSATISATLLLLSACFLLFAGLSYGKILYLVLEHAIMLLNYNSFSGFIRIGFAALKGQPHASSTMLGGTGVDNVV